MQQPGLLQYRTLEFGRHPLFVMALVLIVLAAPAKRAGDGAAVVVGHLSFALGVYLFLLPLHYKAPVLVAVRDMYQRSLLVNDLAPEECAHIAGIPLVRARAWALMATYLSNALSSRLIRIDVLPRLFFYLPLQQQYRRVLIGEGACLPFGCGPALV